MNFIQQMTKNIIELLSSEKLNKQEKAVLNVINKNWGIQHITQAKIARELFDWDTPTLDETLQRQVRRVIRSLRVNHKVPILHDQTGHYLPENFEDARIFLERLEREARGRSASSLETYRVLKDAVGVSSPLFDSMELLEAPQPPTGITVKADGNPINKEPLSAEESRRPVDIVFIEADGRPILDSEKCVTIDWSVAPPEAFSEFYKKK
jgi:hypothetical protein